MNRADFQRIATLRIKEAKTLLDNNCFEGAYYLSDYAVECALKACIAKQSKRYDFPPKEKVIREYYSHSLQNLIRHAGLTTNLDDEINSNSSFALNWAVVKDWSEESRYQTFFAYQSARDIYSAVANRKNGVLPWLRKRW